MPTSAPVRSRLRLLVWLGLLAAAVLVAWFALSGRAALGAAPVTEAAGNVAPASSSAPAATSAEPGGAAASSAPAPDVAALLGDRPAPRDRIAAAPVHVDLHRGDDHYIGADVQLTQKDEAGEINPTPRTVGWYGPPQWDTTPGETSAYPGVLAGHVVHSGLKDVFWRLGEARLGDLVVITYDDGTRAVFRVTRAAESVDKTALTHDPAYGWAWKLAAPGSVVTLITCDLVPGSGLTGASTANWVVQATRVG